MPGRASAASVAALIAEAEAIAAELGAAFIEITAGHHRPEARHLYEIARLRRDRSPPTCGRSSDRPRCARRVARGFPRLRCAEGAAELLDLPWERPLADWRPDADGRIGGLRFRELPVGPSRHLVRFLVGDRRTYALKEEPLEVARREFDVLRHLERARPAGGQGGRPRRGAGARQRRSS